MADEIEDTPQELPTPPEKPVRRYKKVKGKYVLDTPQPPKELHGCAGKPGPGRPSLKTNLDPTLFAGKKEQTPKEALEWVFRNIGKKIEPQDAPSSLAYMLLKDCNDDPDYRKDFCKSILPKYLPTKQQIESQGDESQREREIEKVIKDIRDAAEKATQKANQN